MLIITDLKGNTEALTDYTDLEIIEEVNGEFNLSFTSFLTDRNEHSYPLIQEESIVEWNNHQFRIKSLNEILNRKSIVANHIFFDLIGHYVYSTIGGTKSLSDCLSFILDGTGWTFEVIGSFQSETVSKLGEKNAVNLLREICTIFSCEIKIEPNKKIKVMAEIGEDNDFQFRYKHNIKALSRDVDSGNIATVIKGFGKDGLELEYRSPNINVYGEIHAEPIKDERYSIQSSLLERMKKELKDAPNVSTSIEFVELKKAGYNGEKIGLGDKVYLIYEPLGIEFQTRIMSYSYYPEAPKNSTVVIGNVKEKYGDLIDEIEEDVEEIKEDIEEVKEEYRSKIDQQDDRITLEVEQIGQSISKIEMDAKNIQLSVTNLDKNLRSEISLTDSQIRSTVNAETKRLDGRIDSSNSSITQLSNSITLEVSSINSNIGSMQSQLSIQAGQISSKVERNGIISAINQSPESITLDAQKINLNGITRVADSLQIGASAYDSSYKEIRFKGSASISSTITSEMRISASTLYIQDGTVNFTGANVVGLNVTARFG